MCKYETHVRSMTGGNPKCGGLTDLEQMDHLLRWKTVAAPAPMALTNDLEKLATVHSSSAFSLDLSSRSKVATDLCSIEILSLFQVKMNFDASKILLYCLRYFQC
jgi:hypothetical protein